MQSTKPTAGSQPYTSEQIIQLLRLLANQYQTTLPTLLKRLDNVSGNLSDLDRLFKGDTCVQWNKQQDQLLNKNADLLTRWKGVDSVQRRKKYVGKK